MKRQAAALRGAWLAAMALLGMPDARAHPHGSMDCAATVGVRDGHLAWVDLQLTLDGTASQALRPRVKLEGDTSAPLQAANFNRVLWGLLRQSDWMLVVRPAVASAATRAWTWAWDDQDSARLQADASGRLQARVRLVPAAGLPAVPAHGLQLECRDPTWYWLAGFRQAGQVTSDGARCAATLGDMRSTRSQALALQAAAQNAGAPGADQMDEALARDDAPRAGQAELRCEADAGAGG